MEYTSTRNSSLRVSAAEAIVTGLAPDGGLFVPVEISQIDIEALKGKGYCDVALHVLKSFLPEYDEAFLQDAIARSYGEPFGGNAGKLVSLGKALHSLELWHGPTAAFKDYALQILPKLLPQAKDMIGEKNETHVLVATSGDTGTAALKGFCDIPGVRISCFYPQDGTSEVQRLQMVTQEGENVAVYAVKGNFDDAQRGVKLAFSDKGLAQKLLEKNTKLSSANSINWGRLLPQIVYYITSYLQLCEQGAIQYGDELDYCVPTGNFGDIMAGYYAKALGLPVGKLICASNQNNVLSEFLKTGRYTTKRDFYKTSSPSMDILVSSNLERLLYHEAGSDEKVRGWMEHLSTSGEYTVDSDVLDAIKETFEAGWAGEAEVEAEIKTIFEQQGYLCDPHTAVAFRVVRQLKEAGYSRPVVILSTANPYKFSGKVLASLGHKVPADEFEAMRILEQVSGVAAPKTLACLREKPIRFTAVIERDDVPDIPLRG